MLTVNVHMEKKCAECGKRGCTDSGLCLQCIVKMMKGKPMKSALGQAGQRRFNEQRKNWTRP